MIIEFRIQRSRMIDADRSRQRKENLSNLLKDLQPKSHKKRLRKMSQISTSEYKSKYENFDPPYEPQNSLGEEKEEPKKSKKEKANKEFTERRPHRSKSTKRPIAARKSKLISEKKPKSNNKKGKKTVKRNKSKEKPKE